MHATYIRSLPCSVRHINLRHGIELFSDYSLLLDVTVLVWKLKKNNAKYRQNDFLRFTFKPEVHSNSEMFVTTKWTNQVQIQIPRDHTSVDNIDLTKIPVRFYETNFSTSY